MRSHLASLALATVLAAGCASTGTTTTGGQSPQAIVYAATSGYEAALTAAVAYRRLPACAATVPQPCSDPAIVAQLQKADTVASTAIDAAQAAVRTPAIGASAIDRAIQVASAALSAMTSILATVGAAK